MTIEQYKQQMAMLGVDRGIFDDNNRIKGDRVSDTKEQLYLSEDNHVVKPPPLDEDYSHLNPRYWRAHQEIGKARKPANRSKRA